MDSPLVGATPAPESIATAAPARRGRRTLVLLGGPRTAAITARQGPYSRGQLHAQMTLSSLGLAMLLHSRGQLLLLTLPLPTFDARDPRRRSWSSPGSRTSARHPQPASTSCPPEPVVPATPVFYSESTTSSSARFSFCVNGVPQEPAGSAAGSPVRGKVKVPGHGCKRAGPPTG